MKKKHASNGTYTQVCSIYKAYKLSFETGWIVNICHYVTINFPLKPKRTSEWCKTLNQKINADHSSFHVPSHQSNTSSNSFQSCQHTITSTNKGQLFIMIFIDKLSSAVVYCSEINSFPFYSIIFSLQRKVFMLVRVQFHTFCISLTMKRNLCICLSTTFFAPLCIKVNLYGFK